MPGLQVNQRENPKKEVQQVTNCDAEDTSFVFNPTAFPGDVRERYQNKMDKGLILGSTIRT